VSDQSFVTDGGLETDLIFNHGVDLPDFAAFPLLDDASGRTLLTDYYNAYAAARSGRVTTAIAPVQRSTPTRRRTTTAPSSRRSARRARTGRRR
jgi:homocysteine S-methyltransferase